MPRSRNRSRSRRRSRKQDCVSRKIRILRKEGYPQRQAIAIAYSMCGRARRSRKRR